MQLGEALANIQTTIIMTMWWVTLAYAADTAARCALAGWARRREGRAYGWAVAATALCGLMLAALIYARL